MAELINEVNRIEIETLNVSNAHQYYAKIHMGIAHIHPFWDGNGRIARLLANLPLLKAGLPPLVIPQDQRREYIQALAKLPDFGWSVRRNIGRVAQHQAFERLCAILCIDLFDHQSIG